jgi:hypothetical protein
VSLALTSSATAIAPGRSAFFLGTGGLEPYVYEVLPGGVGGAIDASSGEYTAPVGLTGTDTIQVTDDDATTAILPILVGNPLELVCDILKVELDLDDNHIYLWDQKILQPKDSDLYIAVGIESCKPFGNTNRQVGTDDGVDSHASLNMLATLSIDLISRGPDARDRKEEVLLALNSNYAQNQMAGNSFYVAPLPAGAKFVNLSELDGAAIPYRFRISVQMQYFYTKTKAVPYYDDFSDAEVTTEP